MEDYSLIIHYQYHHDLWSIWGSIERSIMGVLIDIAFDPCVGLWRRCMWGLRRLCDALRSEWIWCVASWIGCVAVLRSLWWNVLRSPKEGSLKEYHTLSVTLCVVPYKSFSNVFFPPSPFILTLSLFKLHIFLPSHVLLTFFLHVLFISF